MLMRWFAWASWITYPARWRNLNVKEGLQDLQQIPDVESVLVYDNQGAVLRSRGPILLDPSGLETAGRLILSTLSSLAVSAEPYMDLDIQYANRRVYVKDLEKVVLVLICNESVDMSLVRLSLNVITQSWKENKQVQRFMKKHHRERIPGDQILTADEVEIH